MTAEHEGPNMTNLTTLNRTRPDGVHTVAGLLTPGTIVRTVGGWDRVRSVRLAPDHAAVVIVTTESDPKRRRLHCDDPVTIFPDGPICDHCGNDITVDGRGHDAECPITESDR